MATFQPYPIFEHGNYIENVTHEGNGIRIVDCSELGLTSMYRIEYGTNYELHTVRYVETEALQVFNNPPKKYHLEVRNVDTYGSIFGTDSYVGTEDDALNDAKRWLQECLTLDTIGKEILVIVADTDECIYHGTFDLVPEKLEVGNYIAVVYQAETVDETDTTHTKLIVEYGTVMSIDGDTVCIADELDLQGNITASSQLFEFPFSTSKVILL